MPPGESQFGLPEGDKCCLPEGDRFVFRRETKVASRRETVWSPGGR